MTDSFSFEEFQKEKESWIHLYGSRSLQLGLLAGYSVDHGYKKERLAVEYPGFSYVLESHLRVNTPSLRMLSACAEYEGSYASSCGENFFYITIDDYLGNSQIAKEIDSRESINFGKEVMNAGIMSTLVIPLLIVAVSLVISVAFIKMENHPKINYPKANISLPTFPAFPTTPQID